MATPRLEHINLTARDPQKSAHALCDIFDWQVRWHGPAINDGYCYHVGTDDLYLAIYSPKSAKAPPPTPKGEPRFLTQAAMNHIGVLVDDLDEIEERVKKAGFTPYSHQVYEPGRRFYFFDGDGVEFEVVSYF